MSFRLGWAAVAAIAVALTGAGASPGARGRGGGTSTLAWIQPGPRALRRLERPQRSWTTSFRPRRGPSARSRRRTLAWTSARTPSALVSAAAQFPGRAATALPRPRAGGAAESRVFAGVHFPIDNKVGLELGRRLARLEVARLSHLSRLLR